MRMLGTTTGIGSTIGVSSVNALASGENQTVQNPEQRVVKETDTYTVIKSKYNGKIKYLRIFTSGDQKGRVEKLEQWSDSDTGTQSIPDGVVEKFNHVIRKFDTCCEFFYGKADTPYDHRQNATALRLTKPADVIGKATLAETLSALAGLLLSTSVYGVLATIGFGVLVSAALSLGTGRNYTFSTHDDHYKVPLACEKPRVITGVANSFKAYPNETVPASLGRGHVKGKHMGSMEYDLPISWDGEIKYPNCRNC